MAFGRGSMTKEMFGNRQPGAKPAMMKPAKPAMMKSGGKVGRGDGCCMKGKTKGTMC